MWIAREADKRASSGVERLRSVERDGEEGIGCPDDFEDGIWRSLQLADPHPSFFMSLVIHQEM